MDSKKNHEVIENKNGQVKIKITIPKDAFKKSYDAMMSKKTSEASLKGFRKGKAPANIVEPMYMNEVLIDTFEKIAPLYAQMAMIDEKLEPVAPAEYSDLPQLDLENDLAFTVVITQMPEFKLGDLKKIKINDEKIDASEQEINEALERLKDQSETKSKELNDAWAKEISEQYKLEKIENLADMKKYISENIKNQKEIIVARSAASDVVKQAVALSKIEVPEQAVKFEASQREQAFLEDLKKIGTPLEVFFERQGITMEDLRARWSMDSKEALENDVLFKLYAESKKIEVSDEELQKEIDTMIAADKSGGDNPTYKDPNWKEYIRSFLLKQKAYNELVESVLGKTELTNHSTHSHADHEGHDHSDHEGHDHEDKKEKKADKKKEIVYSE